MSAPELPRVAVVGGGIAGLAAAHFLAERARVTLLEASDALGGKIASTKVGGLVVEAGADSFLAREPWATKLCEEAGIARSKLIAPAIFGAHIWLGGDLLAAPSDFVYGFPAAPGAALRADLLSRPGALRAAAEMLSPRKLAGPDVAVGAFVRSRFGAEVLERVVDPLLAGTRAGHADELSLAAALPAIDSVARGNRSVTLGLNAVRRSGGDLAGTPPFLTVKGGLGVLVDALAERLRAAGARVVIGTPVATLARRGDGFALTTEAGDVYEVDGAVVATPPYASAKVMRGLDAKVAGLLASLPHATVATATFVFPPGSVSPPEGASGLLVPSSERRTLAAATWYSRKWPQSAPEDGRIVIRCFAGRAAGDVASDLDDDELLARLGSDLADALATRVEPEAAGIVRWERALPQYAVDHLELVKRVESALRAHPGVALAGAGYRGSGIPDCIKSAAAAAAAVLSGLQRR